MISNLTHYNEKLDTIFNESAWSDMKKGLAMPLLIGALGLPMAHADSASKASPIVDMSKTSISQLDMDVVASTLVLEAGGEKHVHAMEAIMGVIMNRAKNNPANFAKVCLRKYQFSCHNNSTLQKDPKKKKAELHENINNAKEHPSWQHAYDLVKASLNGDYTDMTNGSTHYYAHSGENAVKKKPSWIPKKDGGTNKKGEHTMDIGNHRFYKNID
jgi:spore germination cell wall hydrolase CwlJ-like protein